MSERIGQQYFNTKPEKKMCDYYDYKISSFITEI